MFEGLLDGCWRFLDESQEREVVEVWKMKGVSVVRERNLYGDGVAR